MTAILILLVYGCVALAAWGMLKAEAMGWFE